MHHGEREFLYMRLRHFQDVLQYSFDLALDVTCTFINSVSSMVEPFIEPIRWRSTFSRLTIVILSSIVCLIMSVFFSLRPSFSWLISLSSMWITAWWSCLIIFLERIVMMNGLDVLEKMLIKLSCSSLIKWRLWYTWLL